MRIEGKSFLVVGGSSGLGAACTRELLKRGAFVTVADIQQLGDVATGQPQFHLMDVTNPDQVATVLEHVTQANGALHGVIQCAGILGASRLVTRTGPHELELFRRVVEVNLIGTFNVMRLAAQHMQSNHPDEQSERGVIVNTSSVAAFEGQIGQVAYAASKGGVASMTLPAARDLASQGIRVVAIAPGVFQTPMIDAAPESVQQSLVAQCVFPRRLGLPEEFAAFVCHVIENPMLNGSVLRLDGAIRLQPK